MANPGPAEPNNKHGQQQQQCSHHLRLIITIIIIIFDVRRGVRVLAFVCIIPHHTAYIHLPVIMANCIELRTRKNEIDTMPMPMRYMPIIIHECTVPASVSACVWVIGCMVSPVRRDRTLAICMHNWEKGRTTRGMQFAIFTRPFHSMISEIVHQYWMVVIVFWVSACVRLCAAASNFRI